MSHTAELFDSSCKRATRQSGESVPQAGRKLERPCRSFRRFRLGAATVEFAIVLPVFLIMVLGMLEFGRAFMVQQIITNASREGARSAVLDGATTAMVQSSVNTYLASSSISGAEIIVDPSLPRPAGTDYGIPISVTVKVPFNKVSWLPSPMYLGGKALEAKTVMRRESVQ